MMQKDQVLTDILADVCIQYKNQLAVKSEEFLLTYEELDFYTDQLAINLNECLGKTYKSEGIVLLFDNRLFCILAMIAVLKTGRSYIPVDVRYPIELIRHILDDTNNTSFISDNLTFMKSKSVLASGINFSDLVQLDSFPRHTHLTKVHHATGSLLEKVQVNKVKILKNIVEQHKVACIMYTSGSTGKSKGVKVTHQGIISRTYNPKYLSLSEKDVFLSHSNLAFDASTFEIWGALLNGGRLVCIQHHTDVLDHNRLSNVLSANNVSILWQTTALFNYYVRQKQAHIYDELRFLLIGGEAVNKKMLRRYLLSETRKCVVVNGYGPTENCIFSTTHAFFSADDLNENYPQVPIGQPVDQTEVIIVNEQNLRLPVDKIGELLLGGNGLAHSYLNDDVLTECKFIELQQGNQEKRYYRSGDLGFYGADGLIYYVGRKDTQVKINGFRVELEVIANTILSFPAMEEVIVKAITEDRLFLVAYFTTFDKTITLEKLKSYLCEKLPNHMIPKYFVALSSFPRTQNQKIARDKLPYPIGAPGLLMPAITIEHNEFSGAEEKLAQIWEKILGHKEFTLESNFFDVGGDSMKIMALVDELDVHFDKRASVLDLYRSTNILTIVKNILT